MRATRVGSVNERFNKRFDKDPETGCWNWTGYLTPKGYGVIGAVVVDGVRYTESGRKMLAHRVSWLIHRGPIPDSDAAHGTVVMHLCDNPRCVNPKHLRLGTQSENVKDMIQKGRKIVGERLKLTGIKHFRSSIKSQEDMELILNTQGQTKALAERFGVDVSTIKRIRRKNGLVSQDADKFKNKPLTREAIDYIRSTPPGTRGLGKKFGVGKTTISNIRNGRTHAR